MFPRSKETKRKVVFGFVGVSVMLLSFIELWFMMSVLSVPSWIAYPIQTVFSIELNFVLNYIFTWGDVRHESSLKRAFVLFHASRVGLTIPLNQFLFVGQVQMGVPFWAAQTTCIGITTILNYTVGDRLIFRCRKNQGVTNTQRQQGESANVAFPHVSVVIPLKNSTGIDTVLSALAKQSYLGPFDVILVGDYNDRGWQLLDRLPPLTFSVTIVEVNVRTPGRDSNAKRSLGIERSTGDIVALLDDDVVPTKDWMRTLVTLLTNGQVAVAGPLRGIGSTFWDKYIDEAGFSKTPRMKDPYVVSATNAHKLKMPVTANFACHRSLIEVVGTPDLRLTNSYEDYGWFQRILDAGCGIYCTPQLEAPRYHRVGLRPLMREYFRSGKGCADFIALHPHSRFAIKRSLEIWMVPSMALGFAMLVSLLPVAAVSVPLGLVTLSAKSWWKLRTGASVVYPIIGLFFTARFILGAYSRFLKKGVALPESSHILHFSIRARMSNTLEVSS